MNIQLFNFLEDYNAQIVNLLQSKIQRSIPAYNKLPRSEIKLNAGASSGWLH
ncbi:MAG: hypothetical protein R3C68_07045 [Myxococcota bacterium]